MTSGTADRGHRPDDADPPGRVASVNIGQPTALQVGARAITTGIRKTPAGGRVRITEGGLTGDHVLNRRHHGGPDQAVYLYFSADLDFWTEELGETPQGGAFGENLVLTRWASADLRIGDRLDFGPADGGAGPLLEITAPRIPCATLAAHMHDPAFVRRFARARRPGAYARVLREGEVGIGDPVDRLPGPDDAPTLAEVFDLQYSRAPDLKRVRALLAFPLAIRLRRDLEERLADAP